MVYFRKKGGVMDSLETIKPRDINTGKTSFFYDTFGSYEMEIVGRNLVIIAERTNEWTPFTWNGYKEAIKPREAVGEELSALNELVKRGYLELKDDVYSFLPSFVHTLKKYYKDKAL
jgi:hypothetical protein